MRAILTYHSIDPSGSVISLDEELFRLHVDWLSSGAVRVLPVSQLLEAADDSDAVALTFDDGFRNFRETAWPLLQEHGLPATVFVATDRVGGTNGWPSPASLAVPNLPLLDWEELAELQSQGVEVGSHTRTHPDLRELSGEALRDEIAGSADRLAAELGTRPEGFAYPFGILTRAARELVSESYSWACSTTMGLLTDGVDTRALPRLDAYYFRAPGAVEAWGTRRFLSRIWVRRGARALRRGFRSIGVPV